MKHENYPRCLSLPDSMYWPQSKDERERMMSGHAAHVREWQAGLEVHQRHSAAARETGAKLQRRRSR